MARQPINNKLQSAPVVESKPSKSDGEFADLRAVVERAHTEGTTLEEAERLAARFLAAQMQVAEELAKIDLDARMKKNGLKAIKSAVYMAEATREIKKPSDTLLEHHVNLDANVSNAQDRYDTVDARKESLSIYLGIFKDAHIYFRGIAKGRFE